MLDRTVKFKDVRTLSDVEIPLRQVRHEFAEPSAPLIKRGKDTAKLPKLKMGGVPLAKQEIVRKLQQTGARDISTEYKMQCLRGPPDHRQLFGKVGVRPKGCSPLRLCQKKYVQCFVKQLIADNERKDAAIKRRKVAWQRCIARMPQAKVKLIGADETALCRGSRLCICRYLEIVVRAHDPLKELGNVKQDWIPI